METLVHILLMPLTGALVAGKLVLPFYLGYKILTLIVGREDKDS